MLNMVELFLEPVAFARFAMERGLTPRELSADPAYAVHTWLDEALGSKVLRPFRVMQVAPRVRVLGYSLETAAQLKERMDLNAAPSVACVLQDQIASKPMPESFAEGTYLDFEVRLLATQKGPGNVEKDAFLLACDKAGNQAVDRFSVYSGLLAQKLAAAAEVVECTVAKFELASVLRKQGADDGGARKKRLITCPQAVLRGRLRVSSSQALVDMLQSGIGRGSGLGFGMLSLRRAG